MTRITLFAALAGTCAAACAAWAACEGTKNNCSYAGGTFCNGSTTVCSAGLAPVSGDGITCTSQFKAEGQCHVYSNCAAGGCSSTPGGYTNLNCQSSTGPQQCCFCETHVTSYGSGIEYFFCSESEPCTATR